MPPGFFFCIFHWPKRAPLKKKKRPSEEKKAPLWRKKSAPLKSVSAHKFTSAPQKRYRDTVWSYIEGYCFCLLEQNMYICVQKTVCTAAIIFFRYSGQPKLIEMLHTMLICAALYQVVCLAGLPEETSQVCYAKVKSAHNRLLVWFSVALDFLEPLNWIWNVSIFISHKLSRPTPPHQVANGECICSSLLKSSLLLKGCHRFSSQDFQVTGFQKLL